jgi:hypothetical protein
LGRALNVRELSREEYPEWSRFVDQSSAGGPYASTEYLDALCEATGGRYEVVAVFRGQDIVGGVALYEERHRLGTVVKPRLLLQYNGPVFKTYDTKYPSVKTARYVDTARALLDHLAGRRYARLRLKCRSPVRDARPFLSSGWQVHPSYTYVVSLRDLPSAWSKVEQNLRRLIERCRRTGMTMTEDDDFASFYRMHHGTHDRKGASLYLPRDAFERFFRRLRSAGMCRLYHARIEDGRSVSAQLVLASGHPVTHTVSAGADPEYLRSGASAFLRWSAFEDLASRGYEANDLTDAALNPVTHFKSQFGGDLEPCLVMSRPDTGVAALIRIAKEVRTVLPGAQR